MAVNMHLLKPFAIIAGGLAYLQAIIWGVLSLLGILVYTGDIRPGEYDILFYSNFKIVLLFTYFIPPGLLHESDNYPPWVATSLFPMTPGKVVVWTSIYFATSVIWLGISGFLLYNSYISKFTSKIILSWVAVSAVVVVIDLAGTIAFGVDYYRLQNVLPALGVSADRRADYLLAPIFMMMMCARGFILWIMNVGLVIYLGVAAIKLKMKGSPNLLQPGHLSHNPPLNSNYYGSVTPCLVSPNNADSSSGGRMNPGFQPDPMYAWNIQSPTVGNQQQNMSDFQPNNTTHLNDTVYPIQSLHQVGRPVATPVAPLPIALPDYSPSNAMPSKA